MPFKAGRLAKIVVLALLFLVGGVFVRPQKAYALGDVTLTGSAFSDSDAEDTRTASQWIVRHGATTDFDSGTDAVNLTSITIPAATFTLGGTYYWKVKYRDNHFTWSAYSDEASFQYGNAPTPTPTPTPTATPPVPPPFICFGGESGAIYQDPPGQWVCDWSQLNMWVRADQPGQCSSRSSNNLEISYLANYKSVVFLEGQGVSPNTSSDLNEVITKSLNIKHDLYMSYDGGRTFELAAADIDYTKNYKWQSDLWQGKLAKITYNYQIPPDKFYENNQLKFAVHAYSGSASWGQTYTPDPAWSSSSAPTDASDRTDSNFDSCGPCAPTAPTYQNCSAHPIWAKVSSPNGGESYQIGSKITISYLVDSGYLFSNSGGAISKIDNLENDVYLSFDSGRQFWRIGKDVDYAKSYSWVDEPGHTKTLKVNYSYSIPNDQRYVTDQAKVAVHFYSDSSLDWGRSFTPSQGWNDTSSQTDAADRSDNDFKITTAAESTPTPKPTSTPINGPVINVLNPTASSEWKVLSDNKILYEVEYPEGYDKSLQGEVKNVNIYFSKDSGKTFPFIVTLHADNSGGFDFSPIENYITKYAQIKVEGYSADNILLAYGISPTFKIYKNLQCTGPDCRCVGPDCYCTGLICRCVGIQCTKCYGDQCPCRGKDCASCGISQICSQTITDPIIRGINGVLLLGAIVSALTPLFFSLFASIPALSATAERIFGYLFRIWPLLPWYKKRPRWGTVYNSITKRPVKGAILRLYSEPDGRLKETQISGKDGSFGFLAPPGQFSITASLSEYSFPSHFVRAEVDGDYPNIYHGEVLEPSDFNGSSLNQVAINIPLDPAKVIILDATLLSILRTISRFFGYVRVPLMIFGSILTVYLVVKFGGWLNYLILAAYVVLWALEVYDLMMPKIFGEIRDTNGHPLGLVLVRALDGLGRVKATAVTTLEGRFMLKLPDGTYRFTATKIAYVGGQTEFIKVRRQSDIGKIEIKLEKSAVIKEGNK